MTCIFFSFKNSFHIVSYLIISFSFRGSVQGYKMNIELEIVIFA